jgi:hypothetical protein
MKLCETNRQFDHRKQERQAVGINKGQANS